MRARRTTERRSDPVGSHPSNDDIFTDQRMVRIREHKDHIIAVTDMAGHRRLGAESDPTGRERGDRDRSVAQLLAPLIGVVLEGGSGNNVPGRLTESRGWRRRSKRRRNQGPQALQSTWQAVPPRASG